MALARLRVVALVLLAVVCVGMLGFACACVSEQQPAIAVERAVQTPALAPALVEVWPALLLGTFAVGLVVVRPVGARGRASPQVLQRFLF